jgi:hypothetical protein
MVLGNKIWNLPAGLRERVQTAELVAVDLVLQLVDQQASPDELDDARRYLAEQRVLAIRYLSEDEGGETVDFSPRGVVTVGH